MPINYRIDAGEGVIHSRFEGEITLEVVKDYASRVRSDPAFRPGLAELALLSSSLQPTLSAEEVQSFARLFKGLEPIRRIAIVAENQLGFGMGRMFQQLLDGSDTEVSVFREVRSARAWLGLPAEPE